MKDSKYGETIKLIIDLIDEISINYNKVIYSDLNLPTP